MKLEMMEKRTLEMSQRKALEDAKWRAQQRDRELLKVLTASFLQIIENRSLFLVFGYRLLGCSKVDVKNASVQIFCWHKEGIQVSQTKSSTLE